MRKLLLTTTAAALVFSIPALAIDVGVNAGGSVNANAGTNTGGGVNAAAGAKVSTNFNSGGNARSSANVATNFNSGANAGIDVNVGASADVNAAVSAISRSKAEIDQIKSLEEVTSVEIIDMDTLAQGNADISLDKALTENGPGVARLQAALQSKADLMAAILAENPDFDVESVVAADVKADGRLVVYTKG